ncbi:universal stress protein [Aeromicrobium sp.]|uniref:universal stress protein n=1 Tax=Aeromicrobium sp. TaxID=1871063 RepID=UPI0019A07538|nr:universal stress protein [Aeromicrobium sp.]MBC7633592.1 universal stress protein [Aeromicrobium sp.]
MNNSITVGVADKQHAALSYAAAEAVRIGCDLTVLHAYTVPPGPPTALSTAYGVDIEEAFRESGRLVLADAADYLVLEHPGLLVTGVLARGPASKALAEESALARMVVIGPDDAQPWYLRLFESRVARRLAEHSSCPVVVVPDTWDGDADSRGVTLMLDGETTAHEPLRFAFEAADRGSRRLRIIHVLEPDDGGSDSRVWREMTHLIDLWGATHPHVLVTTTVITGVADLTTIGSLEKTGLLVLGRSHESRHITALSRSLAQKVIEHASCPVAVVPPV